MIGWFQLVSLSLCSLSLSSVHHFNLGRRVPGFDYGPDAFGTGLTPLHLSDDGERGAFHFQEPPPPYAAYKYPDIQHPDDPPPPYEASFNPDSFLYMDLGRPKITYGPPCCYCDLLTSCDRTVVIIIRYNVKYLAVSEPCPHCSPQHAMEFR